MIPVSPQILEHHITKFKAGGSAVNPEDEAECRRATNILTLGPAVILRAKRIVQSIVDADTAPAKRASYRRLLKPKSPTTAKHVRASLTKTPVSGFDFIPT